MFSNRLQQNWLFGFILFPIQRLSSKKEPKCTARPSGAAVYNMPFFWLPQSRRKASGLVHIINSLYRYDVYKFTVYKHELDNPVNQCDNWINSLYEDRPSTIWMATREGKLNRFDRETGEIIYFVRNPNNPVSLSHNEISSFLPRQDESSQLSLPSSGLKKWSVNFLAFRLAIPQRPIFYQGSEN